MDDIDSGPEIALETALGKIESGDDSSGSGKKEADTPAPVRVERPDTKSTLLSGNSFQEGAERGMEEGSGGGGGVERKTHGAPHIPRSQITLDMIFKYRKLFTMFRRFLKDQCILRNFNFWVACSHYHQLPSSTVAHQSELVLVARAIYIKYIKSSAPQLVQVKASTKRTIKSILELNPKTISPSLFKLAQDEVWELMEQNEMRQFLASGVFGEMFSDSLSMDMPVGAAVTSCSTE